MWRLLPQLSCTDCSDTANAPDPDWVITVGLTITLAADVDTTTVAIDSYDTTTAESSSSDTTTEAQVHECYQERQENHKEASQGRREQEQVEVTTLKKELKLET